MVINKMKALVSFLCLVSLLWNSATRVTPVFFLGCEAWIQQDRPVRIRLSRRHDQHHSLRSAFPRQKVNQHHRPQDVHLSHRSSPLLATPKNDDTLTTEDRSDVGAPQFDLATALFCAGLAFDAYVEPPVDSSRWEKGSKGLQVAFCSQAYTRQLYKGLLQVQIKSCTGLPQAEEQNTAEWLVSGSGIDAMVMVAALEGSWKEDVALLEREQYHEGVLDLSGAAHVGRTSTAWAQVSEQDSQRAARQRGRPLPFHVPAGWGRGAQSIWPEGSEMPFYLYLQDPATVRLVFTLLDDNKMGDPTPIGSTHKKLVELIPQAGLGPQQVMDQVKKQVLAQLQAQKLQRPQPDPSQAPPVNNSSNEDEFFDLAEIIDTATMTQLGASSWQGDLPLTSKPRKKDKNGQIMAGAVAGAYLAGPVGAAAGAVLASLYEGQIQGRIQLQLRYMPIPPIPTPRRIYRVFGGTPGVDWGSLYGQYLQRLEQEPSPKQILPTQSKERGETTSAPTSASTQSTNTLLKAPDLEHCFFINHDKTGATCAVYRSLEEKLIVVSFRGTCAPIDLITDANLIQEAWVEGDDPKDPLCTKVHAGFRSSLNSIARRLKELILACPAPGDEISSYDMLVTGHSLGGALATLFVADIGQYGIDAGRGLPQLVPSEPWWKSIATTLMGKQAQVSSAQEPPRPKSLRMYNFGSPRVGNDAFATMFEALRGEGLIGQAYRIVNGDDVVARLPRTMNALVFGSVGYDHVGTTVLVSEPNVNETSQNSIIWIEGESDDRACPVRDGIALTSPLAEGSLLGDLYNATRSAFLTDDSQGLVKKDEESSSPWSALTSVASQVTDRMMSLTATDVASVLGLDRSFAEREIRIIQSLLEGKALAHHMENEYYLALGRACGFSACVGEEIKEIEESVDESISTQVDHIT